MSEVTNAYTELAAEPTPEATPERKRRPRTAPTEFGRSLRSFVGSVDPAELVTRVAARMKEDDQAKVGREISRMVSKANAGEGKISRTFTDLVKAVIECVVELDPDQAVKGERLKSGFEFVAITRGENWIAALKDGGERILRKAFSGPGVYKLTFVRELTEEEKGQTADDEAETEVSE